MLQLIKIEWLKIKKYGAFIALAIFFVCGVFGLNYLVYLGKQEVDKVEVVSAITGGNIFDYEVLWHSVCYYGGNLLIFPALLLLILFTNEFTYKTHRQNIIDGWSRMNFVNVKLVYALFFALASTIVTVLMGLLLAAIFAKSKFGLFEMQHIGFFFIKALSYNLMALMLGALIRKSGLAIILYFIYFILENGLSAFLDFWSMRLLNVQKLDLGYLGSYLPLNSADALLTNPFGRMAKDAVTLPKENIYLVLGIALGYMAIFVLITYRKMLKSDL